MDKFLVAFATNDGKNFINNHFGDADFYYIFEIGACSIKYLKFIENNSEEESGVHADPQKAKGVSKILLREKVNVVCSKVFVPNIKRIKKQFVCVLSQDKTIEAASQKLAKNFQKILVEWDKGAARKYLSI